MSDEAERQFVIFDLAGEAYGVNIGSVREIIRMQAVTHVPETPEYAEGVINLRGRVIPVVDLRKRMALHASDQTAESRIVVVEISGHDIGVIVDEVTEVLRVPASAIEPASELIASEDAYYMDGIAKMGERLLILLDLERVLQLSSEGLAAVTQAAA